MKKIVSYKRLIFVVCGLIILSSCTVGYKNDGKEVTWHTWNEGSGHNSRKVDADPKTFEILDDDYGRDESHAFFQGNLIEGADGSSFRTLNEWYAADDRFVYLSGEIVENADPKTFEVHTYYFAEDKNDFFWRGKALNVSDKATFKLLGSNNSWMTQWGKDKYNGYFLAGDCIEGIDYETFHPIEAESSKQSGSYAADKLRVYFMGKEVPGADPESFKEIDFYVGQDKYRAYKKENPTQIKDYTKLTKVGRLMYSD